MATDVTAAKATRTNALFTLYLVGDFTKVKSITEILIDLAGSPADCIDECCFKRALCYADIANDKDCPEILIHHDKYR